MNLHVSGRPLLNMRTRGPTECRWRPPLARSEMGQGSKKSTTRRPSITRSALGAQRMRGRAGSPGSGPTCADRSSMCQGMWDGPADDPSCAVRCN